MSEPRDLMLTTDDTAVCLIDLQERLLAAMHEKEKLVKDAGILVGGANLLEIPVVWSEQYPKGLGPTIPEIAEQLDGGLRAGKMVFSAWREPSFADKLKNTGRKTVILPGIESHVCVLQTALDLLDAGYRVFVPADGVSSRTPENKHVGLELMHNAGAVVTSVEAVVFQLLEKAGGDAFRAFQKLIR